MKKLALIAFLFISCTSADKFSSDEIQKIKIDSIFYKSETAPSEFFLYGIPEEYVINYYWIINGNFVSSKKPKLTYGSYSVELFLVDYFGDTISSKKDFCINEPIKIHLLSPINNYLKTSKDSLEFQYRITGGNCVEYRDSLDVFKEGNLWRVIVFTQDAIYYSETRRWLEN
jgi:hypothetical protein